MEEPNHPESRIFAVTDFRPLNIWAKQPDRAEVFAQWNCRAERAVRLRKRRTKQMKFYNIKDKVESRKRIQFSSSQKFDSYHPIATPLMLETYRFRDVAPRIGTFLCLHDWRSIWSTYRPIVPIAAIAGRLCTMWCAANRSTCHCWWWHNGIRPFRPCARSARSAQCPLEAVKWLSGAIRRLPHRPHSMPSICMCQRLRWWPPQWPVPDLIDAHEVHWWPQTIRCQCSETICNRIKAKKEKSEQIRNERLECDCGPENARGGTEKEQKGHINVFVSKSILNLLTFVRSTPTILKTV